MRSAGKGRKRISNARGKPAGGGAKKAAGGGSVRKKVGKKVGKQVGKKVGKQAGKPATKSRNKVGQASPKFARGARVKSKSAAPKPRQAKVAREARPRNDLRKKARAAAPAVEAKAGLKVADVSESAGRGPRGETGPGRKGYHEGDLPTEAVSAAVASEITDSPTGTLTDTEPKVESGDAPGLPIPIASFTI